MSPRNSWQARIVSLHVSGMPRPFAFNISSGRSTRHRMMSLIVLSRMFRMSHPQSTGPDRPLQSSGENILRFVEKFQEAIPFGFMRPPRSF